MIKILMSIFNINLLHLKLNGGDWESVEWNNNIIEAISEG